MCANFLTKQATLTFPAQICPKIDFGVGTSKVKFWIRNQHLQDTMCANFQSKWTTLNFWPKFGEIVQLHAIFWL